MAPEQLCRLGACADRRGDRDPSSILRAPDEGARQEAMRDFIRDLNAVAKLIKSR